MHSKYVLNDLARPGHVNRLLLHLFVTRQEGSFHYFGSDRLGEALKEKVSALIVSCGVFRKAEQLFKGRDIGVDVRPSHSMVIERGPCPLLF